MNQEAQIKLATAQEFAERIRMTCFMQFQANPPSHLLSIGSDVGNFCHNIRSAVNYTTRLFVETKLIPVLPSNIGNLKYDFPYSQKNTRKDFDALKLVRYIRKHFPDVYAFLEKNQPYYRQNEWLLWLMHISNEDKHIKINEISECKALSLFYTGGPSVKILGPYLMVGSSFFPLPAFFQPLGLLATQQGMGLFLLTVPAMKTNLNVLKYVMDTPRKVEALITEFEAFL